jgi:hypothetical protein
MRRLSVVLFWLFAVGSVAAMEVSTDREVYSPGEEGVITVSLDVPAYYTRLIMEVEILDADANLVYGDIMHSEIPVGVFSEPFRETHNNLEWAEIPENGMVQRSIPFSIPFTAQEGEYTLITRALYENSEVDSDVMNISIVGGTAAIDVFVVVLIFVLIIAIVIWREV